MAILTAVGDLEGLLFLLFLAVVVALSLRKAITRRPSSTQDPKEPVDDAGPWASPFEVKTATHLPTPQIVQGAAYVVDGDTVVIGKTQIRLFGIDAPEMNHPYGVRAKRALISLCKGQSVRAEISDTDAHGRTVARCFLDDGRDLSAEMVKLGLAIDWPKFSGGKYRALETPDARRKLWLADARQKGHMHVWARFDAQRAGRGTQD